MASHHFIMMICYPKKKRRKIDRLLLAQSAEYSGWWLSHASEKYEFVRLDHHPNLVGENIAFMFQTTNQGIL
jgi:hypothetical protein